MSRHLDTILPCAAILAVLGIAGVLWCDYSRESNAARSLPGQHAREPRAAPQAAAALAVPKTETPVSEHSKSPGASTVAETSREPDEALRTLRLKTVEPQALHEAMATLVERLRHSTECVVEVAQRIRAPDCPGSESGRLLACLATAGTSACQNGILDLIEEPRFDVARRLQALRYLARAHDPISRVDAVLERLAGQNGALSADAVEVWAIVGGRIRDRDSARFQAVAAHVRERLASAGNPDELRRALHALGHLGLRDLPVRVLDAANEPDEDVRIAAMRALRKIAAPAAEETLLRSVRDDPSESVRLAALESLADRRRGLGESAQLVLRTVAESDVSAGARRRASEILARCRESGSHTPTNRRESASSRFTRTEVVSSASRG